MCTMSQVGQLLHVLKTYHLFTGHERSNLMPERLADHVAHFVKFSAGGIRACSDSESGAADLGSGREVLT
jgi:hypothetical protein